MSITVTALSKCTAFSEAQNSENSVFMQEISPRANMGIVALRIKDRIHAYLI